MKIFHKTPVIVAVHESTQPLIELFDSQPNLNNLMQEAILCIICILMKSFLVSNGNAIGKWRGVSGSKIFKDISASRESVRMNMHSQSKLKLRTYSNGLFVIMNWTQLSI